MTSALVSKVFPPVTSNPGQTALPRLIVLSLQSVLGKLQVISPEMSVSGIRGRVCDVLLLTGILGGLNEMSSFSSAHQHGDKVPT